MSGWLFWLLLAGHLVAIAGCAVIAYHLGRKTDLWPAASRSTEGEA